MTNLFEYQNKEKITCNFDDFDSFLNRIWKNREKNSYSFKSKNYKKESQQFLKLFKDKNEIKSNNFVGFIQFNDLKINILPKIFYDEKLTYNTDMVAQINNHILWWLSYCRRFKFPNYLTSIGQMNNNFFEILIYTFSKYTINLINSSIYQQYEEINQEMSFVKGSINFNQYISENFCKGKWDKLNCSFDSFVFDNEFNRIIKFVAKLLYNTTSNNESKKNLNDILFILDEVTDIKANIEQCNRLKFNPMFGEYEIVRDYCKLFLSNSVSFNYKNNLKLFAFLLPMEYIFEDFIYGFIKKEIPTLKIKSQPSNTYLDNENQYLLRPDMIIKKNNKCYIADTKYKFLVYKSTDKKNIVYSNDLYQMVTYAIRFNIDTILLLYPNTINYDSDNNYEILINDLLAENKNITVKVIILPILNIDILIQNIDESICIDDMFSETRISLKNAIVNII
jgi:5-methylcytosine-specific restriction enzyme subunit McrC